MKLFLIATCLTILTCSAKAQQLLENPGSIVLKLKKKDNPIFGKLDTLLPYRQSMNVKDSSAIGQFLVRNALGDVIQLPDGMLCLKPKTNTSVAQQMPGSSGNPLIPFQHANPFPTHYGQIILPFQLEKNN